MVWRADDPEGDEASKVKYDVVRYTRGAVLDFGCGPKPSFPHWVGVDSCKDTELFGIQMKPDLVLDCTREEVIAQNFHPESVDAIFSSHLLEHVVDYRAALRAWWSLIKPGGHLILYLPHADLYPRIGQPGANPDHVHDFVPMDLVTAMADVGSWDLVVNETRDQGREYSFLLVFEKLDSKEHAACYFTSYKDPRPPKTAIVVRHGGIGDQLQAAYLLPELKRQGYHITFLTTPAGKMPIREDPHIDEWFMVDVDQVPNQELGPFWHQLAKRYDKFINLNESVEGVFLALPGRIQHTWPQPVRHAMCNKNYAEFAASLAGIKFIPEGRFYATPDETRAAGRRLADIRARFVPDDQPPVIGARDEPWFFIMWTLAGSSPHKFTPWQDAVITTVVQRLSRAIVLMVGDTACKILEAGLYHPRIVPLSGELGVRETLALAKQMDLVIGPETGVMNAVCYELMPKVVMLSHSSPENLTKHWLNTHAIEGNAPCYPCHQLHLDSTFCPRDENTHAAMCQQGVDPARIYGPIDAEYTGWVRQQMLRGSLAA